MIFLRKIVMKKILFLMVSCIGLIFFTSYSMNVIAYVRQVEKWQQEGRYPHLTDLQERVEKALCNVNRLGSDKVLSNKELQRTQDALWEAQLTEAKRLYEEARLVMLRNAQ